MTIQMNLFELDNERADLLGSPYQRKTVTEDDYVMVSQCAVDEAKVTNDIESYYYLSSFTGEVGKVIKKHYGPKPYVEVNFKSKLGLFYMDEVSVILE